MTAAGPSGERTRVITGAELAQMPDHELCELVDGRIVPMSPTNPEHGRIEANLAATLRAIAGTKNLGLVMTGEVGVFTAVNPDRVRGADVVFISHGRYERRTKARSFLDVPPELVVEILSPEHRHVDMSQKVREYLDIGVDLVLVVDPDARIITAYRRTPTPHSYGIADVVPCDEVMAGWVLPVSVAFD